MFEEITAAALKDIGATALVTLTVLMIMTGGLIPRWTHRERMGDKDRQIGYLQAALDKRDEQVEKLLENDGVAIELLKSIKREAERRQE